MAARGPTMVGGNTNFVHAGIGPALHARDGACRRQLHTTCGGSGRRRQRCARFVRTRAASTPSAGPPGPAEVRCTPHYKLQDTGELRHFIQPPSTAELRQRDTSPPQPGNLQVSAWARGRQHAQCAHGARGCALCGHACTRCAQCGSSFHAASKWRVPRARLHAQPHAHTTPRPTPH